MRVRLRHLITLALALFLAVVASFVRIGPLTRSDHLVPPFTLQNTLFAQTPSGWQNFLSMHSSRLTADCTDGSGVTTLQNPCASVTTNAGMQIAFSATASAQAYYLDCDLHYSQATVVADAYGLQFLTAPTNAQVGGFAFTNATTIAAGTPATITNTTATNVVAMTPAVTTVLYAHIGGVVELPSGGQDIVANLLVSQATAANVIVTKRGSICRCWAVQ